MEEELLNATRQNVRLTQLLGEAQRTFELIDEQRRRAANIIESHEKLMAQKTLENSQLKERLAELEHTASCIASVEHLLEFNKEEVSRLTAENGSLKHELKAATKKVGDLMQYKHKVTALTSELTVIKRDLEATNAEAFRTKEELSIAMKTNKDLSLALSSSTDQLTALLTLLLEKNSINNEIVNTCQIEKKTSSMTTSYNSNIESIDQKHLYTILSYQSAILNHTMCPSSSTAVSSLSLFILICTLSTQQILLRRLCAFIDQGASRLSDASERSNFLMSAFALSLVEDFISVLLSPEETLYFIASNTPNLSAFKSALNLSAALQKICGDSFAVLEETLLTGALPVHSQLKLSAPKIRGFFAQILPVLLSSMDMLNGINTGIHAYSSFLSVPSLTERFIFAVTAYTYRTISFNFRKPFHVLTSGFFNDVMSLLFPTQIVSNRLTDQSEPSLDQVDSLFAIFSEKLSTNQSPLLLDFINSTRDITSKINTGNKLIDKQVQELQASRQSYADLKTFLETIQVEASRHFESLISEKHELKVELDRTKAELANLREEHAKTIGLLRVATDRILITEETNSALRDALST